MSQLNNPLEVYKLLPKTNCKLCGMATCLAFAASVIKGERHLDICPYLERSIIEELDVKIVRLPTPEEQLKEMLLPLKREIVKIDFAASVQRLKAKLSGDQLIIKSLGKDFRVDSEGNLISACHNNEWITAPILTYIVYSEGKEPSGEWVTFRELSNEPVWSAYFEHKFEKPFKQLTDAHPELVEDIFDIFNGKTVKTSFSSDFSLVIYPLPKVPMLISYTRPEEDLESKLSVFFDSTAQYNLKIDSIYRLCVGLLVMFEKITSRHS